MDFFEITSRYISTLNNSEKEIYNYIIENMDEIKNSTVRETSSKLFISPATFIRFLRKIGFSGYSDFITVLKYTGKVVEDDYDPFVVSQDKYRVEYLKNVNESIRVLEKDKMKEIVQLLCNKPRLIVIARAMNKAVAHYFEYLFSGLGFEVVFPEDHYYRKMLLNNIHNTDLVFFITYSGEDPELIHAIEDLKMRSQATIISITSANNNTIQNLSTINLYVFADYILYNGIDLTSRISMIGIIDLLAYNYMEKINTKNLMKHNN